MLGNLAPTRTRPMSEAGGVPSILAAHTRDPGEGKTGRRARASLPLSTFPGNHRGADGGGIWPNNPLAHVGAALSAILVVGGASVLFWNFFP